MHAHSDSSPIFTSPPSLLGKEPAPSEVSGGRGMRSINKKAATSAGSFLYVNTTDYPKMLNATVRPARTTDTIDISLIRILRAGPDVSLKGSPTVSPTTDAL